MFLLSILSSVCVRVWMSLPSCSCFTLKILMWLPMSYQVFLPSLIVSPACVCTRVSVYLTLPLCEFSSIIPCASPLCFDQWVLAAHSVTSTRSDCLLWSGPFVALKTMSSGFSHCLHLWVHHPSSLMGCIVHFNGQTCDNSIIYIANKHSLKTGPSLTFCIQQQP